MGGDTTLAPGPGADLRRAREARGLSAHQVAVELHVSDAFIDALERGDYAVLGGPVFARGHLRNYARAVGVPEAQVLAAYDQSQNKPTTPGLVTQHVHVGSMTPRAREWSLRAASAVVVLALLGLALSWWLRRTDETAAPTSDVTQPVTAPISAATGPAPVSSLTELSDSRPAASTQAAKPAPAPAPQPKPASPPMTETARLPRTVPQSAMVVPVTHTAQTVIGPGEARNLTRVKFTLGAASWIEVYDNNGKRLYYDLAPAGDTLELSGAGPLQVFLGNAPGVGVELNGSSFDLKPYLRVDNTARFKLGEAAKPGD